MKTGHRLIGMDGRIGMELLCRKIESMKGKMAEQDKYYTFDLFEEFLFAKMLDSYAPEVFAGEEDPYKITSDEEMAADVEKLLNEFNVGKEMEDEIGEEGIGRDYAGWLARTIHRVDQMKLLSSDEAGFESLFFWDDDYDMVFSGTFVEGIRGLAGGTAALMGYGYEDVKGIFVDIGLNLPLMLVGDRVCV